MPIALHMYCIKHCTTTRIQDTLPPMKLSPSQLALQYVFTHNHSYHLVHSVHTWASWWEATFQKRWGVCLPNHSFVVSQKIHISISLQTPQLYSIFKKFTTTSHQALLHQSSAVPSKHPLDIKFNSRRVRLWIVLYKTIYIRNPLPQYTTPHQPLYPLCNSSIKS